MPLPENIDGLSRAKLKLLLVKLLEEVADLRRAVAALRDDIGRTAGILLNDVQHLDALGRPAARREWPHSRAPEPRDERRRASGVTHLIVESVSDLTADLQKVSGLDATVPLVVGRGDEARHGGGSDSREGKPLQPKPRDIYVPDLHIDTLKLKSRNFR
jgi:hypothetical protein